MIVLVYGPGLATIPSESTLLGTIGTHLEELLVAVILRHPLRWAAKALNGDSTLPSVLLGNLAVPGERGWNGSLVAHILAEPGEEMLALVEGEWQCGFDTYMAMAMWTRLDFSLHFWSLVLAATGAATTARTAAIMARNFMIDDLFSQGIAELVEISRVNGVCHSGRHEP